jgi:hypothetical protein
MRLSKRGKKVDTIELLDRTLGDPNTPFRCTARRN